MKKLSLIAIILLVAGILNAEVTIKTALPNLEVTTLNSWKDGHLEMAMTSKILRISKTNFRVGYVPESKKVISAFSYNIKNLEGLGLRITYLWDGLIDSAIGFYCGYDFSSEVLPDKRLDYGALITVLAINFGK